MKIASLKLGDDEFLDAFHSCRLGGDEFRHADHLRLAWLHTRREPVELAVQNVCEGIRRFAAHLGVPDLYNATVTIAWVRLVATHDEPSFEEFLERNVQFLNKELLHRFWSPEVLTSEAARREWVPPDLGALPGGSWQE